MLERTQSGLHGHIDKQGSRLCRFGYGGRLLACYHQANEYVGQAFHELAGPMSMFGIGFL